MKNAIIFCNRKRDVATLHRSLLRHGFSVQALHGDMDQSARTAALEQFRKNEVTLLVASDVAARGLDIPDVSHIYNFDVPIHADDYVHRIGRTGRAGRNGTAITIVAGSNDGKAVAAIEKLIGQTIPFMDKPAGAPAEPLHEPKHEPRHEPRNESRQTARPPQRGRHEHQRRPQQQPAPVARIEEARSRRAPQPVRKPMDDGDASHLPAFLLRPVPVKA
jgi:superfamily II DNA/RNA helicase